MNDSFYRLARQYIEDNYTDEDKLEELYDGLADKFETTDTELLVYHYKYDSAEPTEIAYDILREAQERKVLAHTELDMSEFDSIFILILVERGL